MAALHPRRRRALVAAYERAKPARARLAKCRPPPQGRGGYLWFQVSRGACGAERPKASSMPYFTDLSEQERRRWPSGSAAGGAGRHDERLGRPSPSSRQTAFAIYAAAGLRQSGWGWKAKGRGRQDEFTTFSRRICRTVPAPTIEPYGAMGSAGGFTWSGFLRRTALSTFRALPSTCSTIPPAASSVFRHGRDITENLAARRPTQALYRQPRLRDCLFELSFRRDPHALLQRRILQLFRLRPG